NPTTAHNQPTTPPTLHRGRAGRRPARPRPAHPGTVRPRTAHPRTAGPRPADRTAGHSQRGAPTAARTLPARAPTAAWTLPAARPWPAAGSHLADPTADRTPARARTVDGSPLAAPTVGRNPRTVGRSPLAARTAGRNPLVDRSLPTAGIRPSGRLAGRLA